MSREAHDALVALLPHHQQKYAPPYKTRIDEHLEPDLRSNLCEGSPHDRLLIQIDRKLAKLLELVRRATGDNAPPDQE